MRRIGIRFLTTVAAVVAVLAASTGVASAQTSRIDVTFDEALPATGFGVLADGGIAGCDAPTTSTGAVSVSTFGSFTTFSGTKTITCLDGSTLELGFAAWVRGCAGTNRGVWIVTDGSGVFEDATGFGRLRGTYPGGDSCTATSVLDRYTGRIRT